MKNRNVSRETIQFSYDIRKDIDIRNMNLIRKKNVMIEKPKYFSYFKYKKIKKYTYKAILKELSGRKVYSNIIGYDNVTQKFVHYVDIGTTKYLCDRYSLEEPSYIDKAILIEDDAGNRHIYEYDHKKGYCVIRFGRY